MCVTWLMFLLQMFVCVCDMVIFYFTAHDDSIWSCAWGRNDRDALGAEVIVTGSVDDTVKVWKWSVFLSVTV